MSEESTPSRYPSSARVYEIMEDGDMVRLLEGGKEKFYVIRWEDPEYPKFPPKIVLRQIDKPDNAIVFSLFKEVIKPKHENN